MFNLTNLNLSSFNTENVDNMASIIKNCSNLTNLDLSLFNTKNVIDATYIFDDCPELKEIILNKISCEEIKNEINDEIIKIKYI